MTGSARPHASGEGPDGVETQPLVEMNGGAVVGGDGEGEFLEMLRAQGLGGCLHQNASESMTLESGLDTDLRRVADARGNFAGQYRAHEIIAPGMTQHKRGIGLKLSATGQQDDVLKKLQSTVPRTVLIVDVAVDVIRVSEINQLGAWLKVAVVPAVKPQSRISGWGGLLMLREVEQHELACVQAKSLVAESRVDRATERHELRFDAMHLR